MGNTQSINKTNFEDIQQLLSTKPGQYLLINTLKIEEQYCLIPNTIPYDKEETIINEHIKKYNKDTKIIIYGKNCNDDTTIQKYKQLYLLGFYNIYIYTGGLFEWLLLQDIYGSSEFPTSSKQLDLLKYKS
jgi:rhodanese-related sulfurtransferase